MPGTYQVGGSNNTSAWLQFGVTLYAIDLNGTTTILGDGLNDAADAEVFDFALPGGSEIPTTVFDAPTQILLAGIGVDAAGDSTYSSGAVNSNPEVNAGATAGTSDRLGLSLEHDALAGEVTLSVFYAGDDGEPLGARIETVVVKVGTDANGNGILDAGEIEGSAQIAADGYVISESGSLDITAAGALDSAGNPVAGNQYGPANPGLFSFDFATAGSFNLIEFSAGALYEKVEGVYRVRTTRGPSDFLLKEVEPDCAEGLTPGYWKNHPEDWNQPYDPTDQFDETFGLANVDLGNFGARGAVDGNAMTLAEALALTGGGKNALVRHAVAALLNSAEEDVDYAYSAAEVIAKVQDAFTPGGTYDGAAGFAALKNLFEYENELGRCGHDLAL